MQSSMASDDKQKAAAGDRRYQNRRSQADSEDDA